MRWELRPRDISVRPNIFFHKVRIILEIVGVLWVLAKHNIRLANPESGAIEKLDDLEQRAIWKTLMAKSTFKEVAQKRWSQNPLRNPRLISLQCKWWIRQPHQYSKIHVAAPNHSPRTAQTRNIIQTIYIADRALDSSWQPW